MRSRLSKLLLCLLLGGLAVSPAIAQGYVDVLEEEIQKPYRERYDKVTAATKATELSEWEGVYSRYIGETYSDILLWTSGTGFAAFRDTCSYGPRAWVNYGSVRFENGALILISEQDHQGEHTLKLSREFTPVRWGHQRWLIPTDEMERFAYDVISGSWQDYGAYYLKDGGGEKDPKGLPDIPKQYRHILKRKPVTTRVVSVSAAEEKRDTEVTIDAGKNKGLIVGMSFWLVGVRNTYVKLYVVTVNEKTSVARIIGVGYSYEYNDDGSPKGTEPAEFVAKPGLRFTSRNPNQDEW